MQTVMFILLTVLVLGGEAEAFVDEYGNCTLYIEGVPHGCTYSQPQATALHDGNRIGDVATCLAVMEAATKAMDPFLPFVHNTRGLNKQEGELYLSKLANADKLWSEMKQQCWTDK